MKHQWIRWAIWCVPAGVALLVAAVAIIPPLGREAQRKRVEAAIARFEVSPSQQDADDLAQLLGRGQATSEQGERILKMLLHPKVITRSAYPLGTPPTFSLERPFYVHLGSVTVSQYVGVWAGGKEQYGDGSDGSNSLGSDPYLYLLHPQPEKPGLYHAEVRCKYAVTMMARETSWSWNPLRGRLPWSLWPHEETAFSASKSAPNYTCQFSVPVELKVVDGNDAEGIDLLAGAEMNARMQRAFTTGALTMKGSYSKYRYTGGLEIKYSDLPAAVAFKATLRLANGIEIPQHDMYRERRRARAGTSGAFQVTPTEFQLEETGDYHATVILMPDPDYAYQDPAIKAIWNGTLEFPISFTIAADDPGR